MQVRGLKSGHISQRLYCDCVAPHAGAWIEIQSGLIRFNPKNVAPHAGAWIEIIVPPSLKDNI